MSELVNPVDLFIEAINEHEKGGQHVGITRCPIRVTHIPTGLMAQAECRSQHRARMVAVRMIEQALTDPEYNP
jgi:protein subunit release factor A